MRRFYGNHPQTQSSICFYLADSIIDILTAFRRHVFPICQLGYIPMKADLTTSPRGGFGHFSQIQILPQNDRNSIRKTSCENKHLAHDTGMSGTYLQQLADVSVTHTYINIF